MVFDAQRSRVLLFGGIAGGTLFGDTWEWTGAAWSQIAVAGPTARSGHAMAFDSQAGRAVLFGGSDGTLLQDTWLRQFPGPRCGVVTG